MKTRFDAGAIAFALLTLSMAAVSHADVLDLKRLRFVDENGVEIESYCVAPLYGKYIDKLFQATTGDGKLYLIAPVLLEEGDGGFYLNWRKRIEHSSIKLRRSWLGDRESFRPDTLLLLKAGRAPFLTSYYTRQNYATETVVFPKGDSNAAIDLLTSDIVDQDAIRSLYGNQRWGSQYRPIVYGYTKEEKALLRTCYKK